MKFLYSLVARLFGFNFRSTPKEVIIDQMNEPRPLPMGKKEFEEWSTRIMMGALVPNEDGHTIHALHYFPQGISDEEATKLEIFREGQKFALANMLLHLGPTESHKPDVFFIHSLRKFAVNQVADAIRVELREAAKARTAQDEMSKGKSAGSSEALVQNS